MSYSVVRLKFERDAICDNRFIKHVFDNPELFGRILSSRRSEFQPCVDKTTCQNDYCQLVFSGGPHFYDPVNHVCRALASNPGFTVYMDFVTKKKIGYAEFSNGRTVVTWAMRRTRKADLVPILEADFLKLDELREKSEIGEDLTLNNISLRNSSFPFHHKKYEDLGERVIKELISDGCVNLEKDYSIYCAKTRWNNALMFDSLLFIGDLEAYADELFFQERFDDEN